VHSHLSVRSRFVTEPARLSRLGVWPSSAYHDRVTSAREAPTASVIDAVLILSQRPPGACSEQVGLSVRTRHHL
jgi:hypothetical protein